MASSSDKSFFIHPLSFKQIFTTLIIYWWKMHNSTLRYFPKIGWTLGRKEGGGCFWLVSKTVLLWSRSTRHKARLLKQFQKYEVGLGERWFLIFCCIVVFLLLCSSLSSIQVQHLLSKVSLELVWEIPPIVSKLTKDKHIRFYWGSSAICLLLYENHFQVLWIHSGNLLIPELQNAIHPEK